MIGSTDAIDTTPYRTWLDLMAVGRGHEVPGSAGQIVVLGYQPHMGRGWPDLSWHCQIGVAYPGKSICSIRGIVGRIVGEIMHNFT